jgi:adenylate cyclase
VRAAAKAAKLAPKMLLWLQQRHFRSAIDRAIFEFLEQELAEHGLSPPRPPRLPAIAFVDLYGNTRLTEERGDERAMLSADLLRDRAKQVARRHDGSLVKLLGDGAMLHFADAASGLAGAVDLVKVLADADLQAHA